MHNKHIHKPSVCKCRPPPPSSVPTHALLPQPTQLVPHMSSKRVSARNLGQSIVLHHSGYRILYVQPAINTSCCTYTTSNHVLNRYPQHSLPVYHHQRLTSKSRSSWAAFGMPPALSLAISHQNPTSNIHS
jgi:hypothetical protein